MSLFAAFRGLHWPIVNCPQLPRFWSQPCLPEMSTFAAFRGNFRPLANAKLSTIAAFWRQDWRKVGQILLHIGGKIGQPAVGATLPPKGGKWGQFQTVGQLLQEGGGEKLPPSTAADREFYPLSNKM